MDSIAYIRIRGNHNLSAVQNYNTIVFLKSQIKFDNSIVKLDFQEDEPC